MGFMVVDCTDRSVEGIYYGDEVVQIREYRLGMQIPCLSQQVLLQYLRLLLRVSIAGHRYLRE